ncbi:MAG: DUF11 domain-containing protein [Eubacteriaceae bacterium]|nr:DUF11 domain-containing protein [Eubacteriaceae bacterium]
MKKKILVGILCLTMIFTMGAASTVLADDSAATPSSEVNAGSETVPEAAGETQTGEATQTGDEATGGDVVQKGDSTVSDDTTSAGTGDNVKDDDSADDSVDENAGEAAKEPSANSDSKKSQGKKATTKVLKTISCDATNMCTITPSGNQITPNTVNATDYYLAYDAGASRYNVDYTFTLNMVQVWKSYKDLTDITPGFGTLEANSYVKATFKMTTKLDSRLKMDESQYTDAIIMNQFKKGNDEEFMKCWTVSGTSVSGNVLSFDLSVNIRGTQLKTWYDAGYMTGSGKYTTLRGTTPADSIWLPAEEYATTAAEKSLDISASSISGNININADEPYAGQVGGNPIAIVNVNYDHAIVPIHLAMLPQSVEGEIDVTKGVDKTKVKVGDTLTYTLNVANNGTADMKDINVTDAVPANTTFVSADNDGVCKTVSGKKTVVWNISELKAGESKDLTMKVKVKKCDKGTSISNVASWTSGDGTTDSTTNKVKTGVTASSSTPAVSSTSGTSGTGSGSATTGDSSSMLVWLIMAAAAAGVGGAAAFRRRRSD